MTLNDVIRKLTPEQMELAEKDLDWMLNALTDPSYILVKRDKSNMFELSSDDPDYLDYIRLILEEKGFRSKIVDGFISLIPIQKTVNSNNSKSFESFIDLDEK